MLHSSFYSWLPTLSLRWVPDSAITAYAMAVLLTTAALLIRIWLQPILGDEIPFATFFAAVALTAWFGNLGPCLVAIVLGAIASWYFLLQPRYTFTLEFAYQGLGLATFIATGLVIAAFSHRMRWAIAQSNQRAKQAEERWQILHTLLANVPEGITMALGRPDFPIIAVSKFAEELVGPSARSVVGMSAGEHIAFTPVLHSDRVTPAKQEEVPLYRAARLGEVIKNERWVLRRHQDGELIDVLVNTVPIRDAQGTIIGAIGCWRDVTEQLALVQRLAESEQRFRAAFEQAAVGMAQIGLDGKWLRVNERLCQITGYSREELRTRGPHDLTHPDDRESALTRMRALRAGEIKHYTLEKRYIRRDHSTVWVNHTVALVHNQGEPQYFIAVTEDISARKAAEAQIQRLHETLEHRVEERTAELAAVNHDLEAFSYSVSHDLRAPLRAIDGFSQILIEDCGAFLSSDARDYLARIQQSTRHMAQLVDDLLDFARLGRKPLDKQELALRPMVEHCVETLKDAHRDQFIEVSIGTLPACHCDPSLLRQVFVNLLSNAIKFSRDAPHPKIEVGSLRQDGENIVYVRDNGMGFDMRYAEKIFGVFERLQRVEDYEGTGVGLAIVKRIIERHGGRIWVEAQPGKGATFYFTLPAPESAT